MTVREKIAALRGLMAERGIDAYVVPSGDAHASEYMAEYWHSREWVSGFTGSAGVVVVTPDEAGLWTDGRYFIQAECELAGSGITLYRSGEPGVPTYRAFLAERSKIAFDGRTVTAAEFSRMKAEIVNAEFSYAEDLIGEIRKDRPPMPMGKAFEHAPRFAGKTVSEKLQDVREKMREKNIGAYLVTALDSVAWLFNIRGSDIGSLPVPYAFAVVMEAEAYIFLDCEKLEMRISGVTQCDYDDLPSFLRRTKTKIFYNPTNTNVLLSEAIPEKQEFEPAEEIIPLLKAVKSEIEIKNIKNAFVKDSVVVTKLLFWIHTQMEKDAPLTEGEIAIKLKSLRQEQPHYLCDSFKTIAAYGANAAQAHYNTAYPGEPLKPQGFLLIDTGGQYLDGTTDTTRTISLGALTDEMKRSFTLVLKGHIALAQAVFPAGTTGTNLDILARLPLLQNGQNFRHGTGHGLGYCLSIHEGPHNISPYPNAIALSPGMLVTNEPAYYKQGEYGIRTENAILVTEKQTTPDGKFLHFETLTHCPIDTSAIIPTLLTPNERNWLNTYHQRTNQILSPHLTPEERNWLTHATREI